VLELIHAEIVFVSLFVRPQIMHDIKLEPVFKSIEVQSLEFITSSKRHFQRAGSFLCFALVLDRIKAVVDEVQLPVDKLETQHLRKIPHSPSQIFHYHN